MNVESRLIKSAEMNNGMLTMKMLTDKGIHREHVSLLVDKKKLRRVERGVYALPNAVEDMMYATQVRFGRGVYSHLSALYLHDLTDRAPLKHTMTFPLSYNVGNVEAHGLKTHRTKHYGLGQIKAKTPYGNTVTLYDPERTLCDMVRIRRRTDISLIADAFHAYMKRKERNIRKLKKYAKTLGVAHVVNRYLEVLQR